MERFALEKEAYINKCMTYSRSDLLKSCREIGFSAHKIKEKKSLALFLWQMIGQYKAIEDLD